MEILANTIRKDKAARIRKVETELAVFEDDMIIFRKPKIINGKLLQSIGNLNKVAAYEITIQKIAFVYKDNNLLQNILKENNNNKS